MLRIPISDIDGGDVGGGELVATLVMPVIAAIVEAPVVVAQVVAADVVVVINSCQIPTSQHLLLAFAPILVFGFFQSLLLSSNPDN